MTVFCGVAARAARVGCLAHPMEPALVLAGWLQRSSVNNTGRHFTCDTSLVQSVRDNLGATEP